MTCGEFGGQIRYILSLRIYKVNSSSLEFWVLGVRLYGRHLLDVEVLLHLEDTVVVDDGDGAGEDVAAIFAGNLWDDTPIGACKTHLKLGFPSESEVVNR